LSDIHADFGIYYFKISEELRAQSLEAQRKWITISVVEETLGGLKVIKVTMLSLLKSRFNDSVTRLLNLTNSIGSRKQLGYPLSEFLGVTTIAILLFLRRPSFK
jgi:subfamily B ATP-binding cassette protein MsbA